MDHPEVLEKPVVGSKHKAKNNLVKKARVKETIIQGFLFLCGALSILVTTGIIVELGKESMLFFSRTQWESMNRSIAEDITETSTNLSIEDGGLTIRVDDIIRVDDEVMKVVGINGQSLIVERGVRDTEVGNHTSSTDIKRASQVTLREFLLKTEWNPQIGKFGIWALVNATLMTSLIAIIVALPLGLGVAIYLSEYASSRARNFLKPILEVLSGIPTVVYGYFALTFVTPLLRGIFGSNTVEVYNTASAGIVIGVLILPLVSSMSEDALSAVPGSLREAAYSLGATKFEAAVKVVVPAAFSGIAAAMIIAISRAIGETMIVAVAAGAGPNFTFNPFKGAETMTGHIVRISGGDLSYDSLDYNSIFAIGLMLFIMTLGLNILSQRIVKRFREEYE
jgi:phosphate transport system permease protein